MSDSVVETVSLPPPGGGGGGGGGVAMGTVDKHLGM